MNIIKKLPIPISGLILASLSLGNLLQDVHPSLRFLFGAIGIIFLILIILKVVLYPQRIKDDFKNPVIVSSSGTFSMSLMILSNLISFMPNISYTLWIIGIVLHILLIIYFTYHFIIRKFDISNVYPSYWIVYVGITMAAITANVHGINKIDFIFFIIGFMGMLASTPLVLYREFIYNKNSGNEQASHMHLHRIIQHIDCGICKLSRHYFKRVSNGPLHRGINILHFCIIQTD